MNYKRIKNGLEHRANRFITTDFDKQQPSEKGYIYFQDFIPNNDSDARVIVIGDKAFAIKRMVRSNDFRASGSGQLLYDNDQIPEPMIRIAFDVAKSIGMQSVAFDFVLNESNQPLTVEISYGFGMDKDELDHGYWGPELNWHEGQFNPQEWMIDDLLKHFAEKTRIL